MVSRAVAAPLSVTLVAGGLLPIWLGQGQAEPAVSSSVPVSALVTIEQVRKLTADEAQGAHPVALRGIVTFYDDAWGQLFVQDATAGIRVTPPGGELPVRPGDRVELTGTSARGDFAPSIAASAVRVLEPGKLPSPKSPGFRGLVSGRFDSQWIALSGVVRTVSALRGRLMLELATPELRLDVFIPGFGDEPPPLHLVDAKVRLRGVCATRVNARQQSIGIQLLAPDLDHVEVVQPAVVDPFALPVRPIRTLMQFSTSEDEGHRVKVQGVVTLQRGGNNVFLQDATAGLYTVAARGGAPPLEPGDVVEAVGFPELGAYTPILRDAIIRKVGQAPLPAPIPVTVSEATRGTNDTELIQLEARFLESERRNDDVVLVLQDGQWVFQAFVPAAAGEARTKALTRGTLLRLTGVCSVMVDEQRQPRSFRLLLRSAEDVAVVQSPPWWTLPRALAAAGAMTFLVLGTLAWVWTLRRRLVVQTSLIRQRLEREAALERRYQELFEKANDIVYTHDLEGNFTTFNVAAQKLLGYTVEESRRLNVADLVAAEHLERARAMTTRKLEGEDATTYELDLLAKDGHRVSVEVSSRPILQDGRIIGVQGIARDITERKRAARELEESLSLLHATLESTADGILVLDREGRILNFNQTFLRMWKIPADLISSRDHERLFKFMLEQLADPERFLQRLGELGANPQEASFDVVSFRDGRVFDGYSLPQRVGGEVLGRVLSFSDVTEQRRAEAALRQSEELFSKAFHASPAGIGICTLAEGRYLKVNDAFLSMLGYAREEVIGRTASELGIWVSTEQCASILQTLSERKQAHNQECQFRAKSGAVRTVLASLEQIELDGEQCVVFIHHDVTERLQLEEQFRQAQKMESVGRLAAGVAHDFNNMLTVISGHASLLLVEPDLKPQYAESINQIAGAAERAGNLTRQLLAFSRRQPLQLRSLNVNEVLTNLSKMLCRLLGENIRLQCRYSPTPPAVRADAGMIEQAIMNLVVNARDAMPQGGELVLSTQIITFDDRRRMRHPQARAGQYVCLSVTDTGCGMPPDTLKKIFEPFFTTKEVGKGTGLGLATVYGIVQQHHGWVEVTSQVGKGTTFDLYLPRVVVSDTELLRQFKQAVAPGCETILLVEDEPAVLKMVKNVLCRSGYRVLEVANGEEALEAWAQHKADIDLVLTDLVMPGRLTGSDLAERLRAERQDLRIILSSGYSAELSSVSHPDGPGMRYLWKPYTPQELTQTVRRCLDEALPRELN